MADQGKNAANPFGFASILTKKWRKSSDKKHGSDYYRHPKCANSGRSTRAEHIREGTAAEKFLMQRRQNAPMSTQREWSIAVRIAPLQASSYKPEWNRGLTASVAFAAEADFLF